MADQWDAKKWIEADGYNPSLSDGPFFPFQQGVKEVDLQHDSTDTELSEIAKIIHESAACESLVTLENLDSYLLSQRDILRTREKCRRALSD